jgi:deaminated glutathione amidase
MVERSIASNGRHIRDLLDEAAAQGARLALLPEGALSGCAKAQITDWAELDWALLDAELAATIEHCRQLGIVAVVGAAHPVAGRRPHNSLQVLPDGPRYDKRYLSFTEVTDWYTPGFEPCTFGNGGFSFGMTLCIEAQFPELFAAYEELGADCVLHATYGVGSVGEVILRGHAATNCLWLAIATPANAAQPPSGIIGPDGNWMARCGIGPEVLVVSLDQADPLFDIALNKARPWRRTARSGRIYRDAV